MDRRRAASTREGDLLTPRNILQFDTFTNDPAETNDDLIYSCILNHGPISPMGISIITDINKGHVCQRLKKMEKLGIVRLSTRKMTTFWEVTRK